MRRFRRCSPPLSSPDSFYFESKLGARLRVHWEESAPPLAEPDWHRQFSVESDAPRQVLRAEQGQVRGPDFTPPSGFAPTASTFMHLARVVRANDYQGEPHLYTFALGYAELGSRYLKIEYYDDHRARWSLDAFYQLLGSIHAQQD